MWLVIGMIFGVCLFIYCAIAYYSRSSTEIPSKLILSVRHLEITDPKAELTMDLLFNNDDTKEFIIDNLFMITPGNSMSALDDNDNMLNNFKRLLP